MGDSCDFLFLNDLRNSSVSLPDRLRIGLFCVVSVVLDFRSDTSLLLLWTIATGFVATTTGASEPLPLCALLNSVDSEVLSLLFLLLTSLVDRPRGVFSGAPSSLFLLPILLSFFLRCGKEKNFSGG